MRFRMNVRILLATLATIILAACGGTPDATLIIDQTPDAPTMTAPEPDAGLAAIWPTGRNGCGGGDLSGLGWALCRKRDLCLQRR